MTQNSTHLLTVFYRHRWPALAAFGSVLLGAIIYFALAPRLYKSQVRLIHDAKPAESVSSLGRDVSQQPGQGVTSLATQEELISSKHILEKAWQAYELQSGQQTEPQVMLGEVSGGLQLSTVPGTEIIQIALETRDPELSASFLNLIAKTAIQDNTETIRQEARSARQFLELQVPQRRQQLAQVEDRISKFKRSYGYISLGSTDGEGNSSEASRLLVQSLATQEDELRALASQLREVSDKNSSLRSLISASTISDTYQGVRSGQDPELQNLRAKLTDLESQVSARRADLTDDHPEMVKLLRERDAARSLYAQKLSRLTGNSQLATRPESVAADNVSQTLSTQLIEGEIEQRSLQEKMIAVRNNIEQLEARRKQYPILEQAFAQLERQRQAISDSLQLLERKLDEARIAEAQLVSNLRVIALAEPSNGPSSPKLPVILVLGTAAGMALAISTVLLLELLDRKLHNVSEIEQLVKLPVLSMLPILPEDAIDLGSAEAFFDDPALVEAYRTLLKSLEFRFLENLPTLVISSTISGEGKSVVASHLAAVAAMLSRRTLLIDADLRHPTQNRLFNLNKQLGLTDIIIGDYSLDEAAKPTSIDNLSVITTGSSHIYPSRFFESDGIHYLLKQANSQYDLVIVDTPPITSCVDALSLSRDSSKLLLVARPNLTEKELLQQSVAELTDNGISILGVAVNGMDSRADRYYRYKLESYQRAS